MKNNKEQTGKINWNNKTNDDFIYLVAGIKCGKCGVFLNPNEQRKTETALKNNTGNIRKWFKRGLKYGFRCSKCHSVFNKNKGVYLK